MTSNNLRLDKSGRSEALFFKDKKNIFSKKLVRYLEDHYKKNKHEIRFCIHENKKTNLQVMINLILKKTRYQLHYHNFSDEYYIPLKGNLKLLTFNKKKKFDNSFILNKDNSFLGKIYKGQTHIAIPLNRYCVYLEFRSGNFTQHKNTFLNKYLSYKKAVKL